MSKTQPSLILDQPFGTPLSPRRQRGFLLIADQIGIGKRDFRHRFGRTRIGYAAPVLEITKQGGSNP